MYVEEVGAQHGAIRTVRRYAGDLRVWIVLFFLLRLVGITNAPTEMGHAWRQCFTAMIARNLPYSGWDVFHPRIDTGGEGAGIIGSEFPLLNVLIAFMNAAIGPAHWYGRLIVLVSCSLGVHYYHLLVKRLFGERVAFASAVILLASVWFEFGRKIMPDVFSISLMLIALWHAYRFIHEGRTWRSLSFAFLALAAGLSKLPAMALAAPLLLVVFDQRVAMRRRVYLSVAVLLAVGVVVLWYFIWVPHLVDAFHHPLFFPRSISLGIHELWKQRGHTAEMFYFQAFRSFLAFGAFTVGLWSLFARGDRRVIIGALLLVAPLVFFMIKAGEVFSLHSYYVVPFVPMMAVVAAFALVRLPVKWSLAVLAMIAMEGVANQYYDLFSPDRTRYLLELETLADRHTRQEELIVVNGGLDPTLMYFLHRKGWSIAAEQCEDRAFIADLARRGATTLFLFNAQKMTELPILYSDAQVQVVDLRATYFGAVR